MRRSVFLGLIVGTLLALSITIGFTTWDWIENPGGIFRGDQGTNWKIVFETALSWFLPCVLLLVPIIGLANFAYQRLTQPSNAAKTEEER